MAASQHKLVFHQYCQLQLDFLHRLQNDTINWSMPSMISPRIQKSLVDSPTNKLKQIVWIAQPLFTNHVFETIFSVFQPKFVFQIYIFDWHRRYQQRIVFTSTNNCIFIMIDWPTLLFESSQEKVMPAFKTKCFMGLVNLKFIRIPIFEG